MADMTPEDDGPMRLDEPGNPTPPKRGPGRPPGSKNRTTAPPRGHAADVTAALAVMGGAYDFILLGLTMVSPMAAMQWEEKIEPLQASNKGFFTASPKLAARIAKIGSTGGTLAFVMSNVIALVPVIQIAIPDITRTFETPNDADQSTL